VLMYFEEGQSMLLIVAIQTALNSYFGCDNVSLTQNIK